MAASPCSTHPAKFVATIVLALVVGACGGDDGGAAEQQAAAPEPAPTRSQLPPDHPPLTEPAPATAPAPAIAPPPPGSGQGAAALTWTAPDGWIAEIPSNAMRRAQYRVPGPGGDAECVVYYFGPGQGGDAVSNAERWAEQFSQPDGGDSVSRMLSERLTVGDVEVLMVEVRGTYNSAMMMGGPSESLPGYMLLGAIAAGGDSNWFFKFTGPEATVAPQREAFRTMIRSLSRGG